MFPRVVFSPHNRRVHSKGMRNAFEYVRNDNLYDHQDVHYIYVPTTMCINIEDRTIHVTSRVLVYVCFIQKPLVAYSKSRILFLKLFGFIFLVSAIDLKKLDYLIDGFRGKIDLFQIFTTADSRRVGHRRVDKFDYSKFRTIYYRPYF